jgi:hypothetical protein
VPAPPSILPSGRKGRLARAPMPGSMLGRCSRSLPDPSLLTKGRLACAPTPGSTLGRCSRSPPDPSLLTKGRLAHVPTPGSTLGRYSQSPPDPSLLATRVSHQVGRGRRRRYVLSFLDVSYRCFKCFVWMLQKQIWVLHCICCNDTIRMLQTYVFQVFQLFQTYFSSSSRRCRNIFGCCITCMFPA